MSQSLEELFFGPKTLSTVERLNSLSFDELVEIDLINDRCRNIYHVDGKYFVPVFDGTYLDLYRFSCGHMIHPDDLRLYRGFMDPGTILKRLKEAPTPGLLSAEFRYKLQDGGWRWVRQFVVGGPEQGFPEGIINFYVFDIQNRKDREQGKSVTDVRKATFNRDETTRLLRERVFFEGAEELVNEPDSPQWCFLAIDIYHFRLFNDWYGRAEGDLLLANVGERLIATRAELGGLAGYLGQDDFCMLMPYDVEAIQALYDGICEDIAVYTTSIGFAPLFGVSAIDGQMPLLDVFDQAKVAMDHARTSFKENICFFEDDMKVEADKEYRVLLDFKQALRDGEFIVYLQPQCRASSGKVVGVEALVRWQKPDGTIVSPADFLPALERNGFITDLDCYVWNDVCLHAKRWIDSGHTPVPVSMNVSQVDLFTIDVVGHFRALSQKHDLPPSLMKIEITESAFADNPAVVMDVVDRLREEGFLVMMDDFGSGFSSLNMLSNLNVDVIKLDGQFLRVTDEVSRRKGMRIVESVVNMAKTMAMPVIAEGVETKEQVEFLESLGVRYIQGFYYYRPMPLEEYERLALDGKLLEEGGFVAKLNEQMRIREFLDENVYSDAMLNSILGPVAIYLRHDDDVDIIRFNEQFYEAVSEPEFDGRLLGIQKTVPQQELAEFYALFDRAVEDDLNGASGFVSFIRADGSYARFQMHLYYLGETSEGERFYGSARNVTSVMGLRHQMEVLSNCLSSTIVAVSYDEGNWGFEVVVHGMEDRLGVSREGFRLSLANGTFFDRIAPEDRAQMREKTHAALETRESFSHEFVLRGDQGQELPLFMKADFARSSKFVESPDVTFIVTLDLNWDR